MSGEMHGDNAVASNGVVLPGVEENKPGHYGATLTIIILPFVGLSIAIALAWWQGWFYWSDLAMLIGIHLVAAAGITIGFHRLLTHRSFETKPWVRAMFTIAGSLAIEGKPINWVADHRKHHAFTDVEGDPHSPHVGYDDGSWRGAWRGFWHAHVGWLLSTGQAPADRYAKDLLKDKTVMKISDRFGLFVILVIVSPAIIGFLVNGLKWQAAVTGLLWAGIVRIGLTHHITWSVNSVCHMFGKRPFELDDQSTNNWALAVPTLGESWHHNHHAFPTSARHGLLKGQIDISHRIIKIFEMLGLVWDVKQPSPEEIQKRLVST